MGVEIERKFLVTNDDWRPDATSTTIKQGYMLRAPDKTVRVRLAGNEAFITIKGPGSLVRSEFEYPIPTADADELLALCEAAVIDKVRHVVTVGEHTWEIDEFHGTLEGLVVAEIELGSENETFELPAWAGNEVTYDSRYANAELSRTGIVPN